MQFTRYAQKCSLLHQYSSWRHRVGSSRNGWKYRNWIFQESNRTLMCSACAPNSSLWEVIILKSDSHLLKKVVLFASMKALQKWWKISSKKLFLFSKYLIFVLTFWSFRKNGLIRNIRLISKFMTSQPG